MRRRRLVRARVGRCPARPDSRPSRATPRLARRHCRRPRRTPACLRGGRRRRAAGPRGPGTTSNRVARSTANPPSPRTHGAHLSADDSLAVPWTGDHARAVACLDPGRCAGRLRATVAEGRERVVPQVQLSASQTGHDAATAAPGARSGSAHPRAAHVRAPGGARALRSAGVHVTDLNGHSVGGMEMTCDGRRRLALVPIEPDPCLGRRITAGPTTSGTCTGTSIPTRPRNAASSWRATRSRSVSATARPHRPVLLPPLPRAFSVEELALLWMLGPVLQRFVRERPTPSCRRP